MTLSKFEYQGGVPQYTPNINFKLNHFVLNLLIPDLETPFLNGEIRLDLLVFTSSKVIYLDAGGDIEIKTVELTGDTSIPLKFDHIDDKLIVYLDGISNFKSGDEFSICVKYSLQNPKKGIFFIKPSPEFKDNKIQVYTQGESQEISLFMPIFDCVRQICSSEFYINVQDKFTALANGILIGTENLESQKRKIYHWKSTKKYPVYLTAITIGDYDKESVVNKNGLEIASYIGKGDKHILSRKSALLPEMLEFLENFYGVPFPFEKCYQVWVSNFIWGGMENASLIVNNDASLMDEKGVKDFVRDESVIIHELAHQWFGDLVVINDWSEIWLKEGAAVSAENFWWEYKYGADKSRYYRHEEIELYLSEASRYKRPLNINVYKHPEDLYDVGHTYVKGGRIYCMIRDYIGNDALYKSFIQDFLTVNGGGNIGYQDMLKSCYKTTGKNIKPLLDQFAFRGGHPEFKMDYSWDGSGNFLKFNVTQKQYRSEGKLETIFDLDNLKLDIFYLDSQNNIEKTITKVIHVNQPVQSFYIHLDKKPDFAVLDGEKFYILDAELGYGDKDLELIAKYHPSLLARIDAINEIGKKGGSKNLEKLVEIYKQEKFTKVKSNILGSISNFKTENVPGIVINLIKGETLGAVLAVGFSVISKFPEYENGFQFLKSYCKNSENGYQQEASALVNLGILSSKQSENNQKIAFELFEDYLKKEKYSYKNIVEVSVVKGLTRLIDFDPAFDLIVKILNQKNNYPNLIRRALFMFSGEFLKYGDQKRTTILLDVFEKNLTDPFMLTQISIGLGLSKINCARSISLLSFLKNSTGTHRIFRICEKGIESVRKNLSSKETAKNVDSKLEKIEKENINLKAKIEEITEQIKGIAEKKDNKKDEKKDIN